jgi:predicted transcriptional regulator
MTTEANRRKFGRLLLNMVEAADITKPVLAAEVGIGLTTLYRIFKGETKISKATVVALGDAINKLSGTSQLNDYIMLEAAGYEKNGANGSRPAHSRIVELIAAHSANLPDNVQEDVLAIVRTLEKRHTAPKRAAVGK